MSIRQRSEDQGQVAPIIDRRLVARNEPYRRMASPYRPMQRFAKALGYDFGLILLGAFLLMLLVVFSDASAVAQVLRAVLGVAFVLLAPGYCLVASLLPRAEAVDGLERVGLSIGASVGTVAVLAVVLGRFTPGLHTGPILAGLFLVTGVALVSATWRRSVLGQEAYRPALTAVDAMLSLPGMRGLWNRAATVGAVLLLALAVALLALPPRDQYSEFYVLAEGGLAQNFQYDVALTEDVRVNLGVANRHDREITYRVSAVLADGQGPGRPAELFSSDTFPLKAGETREQAMSWRMPRVGNDQTVALLLFEDGGDVPSRQLRLWLNVQDGT